jgi:hypothetical protein
VIVPQPPASAVSFVDAQHGWYGTAKGLFGTSDGRTFRLEARAPIIGISTRGGLPRAFAITGDGFVLRTTHGEHWQRLGAPHLFSVQWVESRILVGMTRDGVLVRSDDSGRTWKQARAPGVVQSECFTTDAYGWVARGGTVWRTIDAGRTWARARLRSGPQELPELGCNYGGAWVVFHEGAAAGTEGYHVFHWLGRGPWRLVYASPFQSKVRSISNYAGPFTVLRRGAGVFTGSCAPCDGAGTATLVSPSSRATWRGPPPTAVSFLDARHGWIVSGGRLRETADGGRHWRTL